MKRVSLTQYLVEEQRLHNTIPAELRLLIEVVARACKTISHAVGKGALGDVMGSANTENIQGEVQKKLDIISNEILLEANEWGGHLAAMASEEMEIGTPDSKSLSEGRIHAAIRSARRLQQYRRERLHWHNFLGLKSARRHGLNRPKPIFMQPGSKQVAAGYAIYGPQTVFVLTTGNGVNCFTLDRELGSWVLTHRNMTIPATTKEFAINASNARHWHPPVQRYINEMLAGKTGPRGEDFNMRWIASMVADVHRIMSRGGIFMYPADLRDTSMPGKLRLMYEANPMAFIVEQAGGAATDGKMPHYGHPTAKTAPARAGFLGSKNEVERVTQLSFGSLQKSG